MFLKLVVILNSCYLAFAPIGRIYEVFRSTSLSNCIALLLLLLNSFYILDYFKVRKREFILLLSLTLIGFLSFCVNIDTFDFVLFFTNLYALFLFSAGLLLTAKIDIRIFKICLVLFGLIASVICFIQMFQMLTQGTFDNFYFSGLNLYRENSDELLRIRPYSIFSEPAHLAIYLLPIFYYSLINKYYLISIIFALGILCSGSTTGLLLLVVVCVVSFKLSIKNIIICFVLGVVVVNVIYMISPDILLKNFDKLEGTDSNNIRLLGALSYVGYFSIGNWFLGVGYNQVDNFVLYNGIARYTNGVFVTGNYAPTIIYTFICYGIIGLLVFLNYLKSIYSKCRKTVGFFVIMLGILCSDQILYNANLLYLWAIVLIGDYMIDEYKPSKFFC